jgi:amidase
MGKTSPNSRVFGRKLDRRRFLGLGAAAAATPAVAERAAEGALARLDLPARSIEEATIAELQAAMAEGRLSARALVRRYLRRIEALDERGPRLNSIIELNPDAEAIAGGLDRERRAGRVRGPLHGIPILLKDNIDTADRMMTTAGSLALVGRAPPQDATVVKRLRDAGAVILGKTNLSEWANFRSFHSSSGWSGRDGQTRNPYVLDRNPCGSSSGSGVAPSANLTVVSLGTETDGSIVCPASINAVVGIKPTVGLTSRAGVVPIAHSQDTVGPLGRTVGDAAAALGALTGVDDRDEATRASAGRFHTDYAEFLDPQGLRGTRIGVAREGVSGYSEETDGVFNDAVSAMRDAGADIVDPADFPAEVIEKINAGNEEITVLVYEFKRDLNAYLATRTGVPIKTLADAIAFNLAHREQELKWFLQELFDLAESDPFTEQEYLAALAEARRLGGPAGIDAVLAQHNLDAIVAPTASPAWPIDLVNGDHFLGASSSPAAIAGYPLINVPAGEAFGLPVGITFMGTAFSEPKLIKLASGFEQATRARRKPGFLPTLPLDGQGDRPRVQSAGRRRKLDLERTPQVTHEKPVMI